jgi:hypothetical protein
MADRVIVPDVVGFPFRVGRDRAAECGVAIANPDPDGRSISGLAWPGLFYITSQSPPAGAEVYRWGSVMVEIVEHGEVGHAARSSWPVMPAADAAHANTGQLNFVDLSLTEITNQNSG